MLINKTKLPKSTIGDEIKKENVTPKGSPALVKPMNSGIDEQEQKGGYSSQQSGDDVRPDPMETT